MADRVLVVLLILGVVLSLLNAYYSRYQLAAPIGWVVAALINAASLTLVLW